MTFSPEFWWIAILIALLIGTIINYGSVLIKFLGQVSGVHEELIQHQNDRLDKILNKLEEIHDAAERTADYVGSVELNTRRGGHDPDP